MPKRTAKKLPTIQISVPPEVPPWNEAPAFESLQGRGWQRLVPVESGLRGFALAAATTYRENAFTAWSGSDTHRFVRGLIADFNRGETGVRRFAETVVGPLLTTHGSLFGEPRTLREWRTAMNDIAEAAMQADQFLEGLTSKDETLQLFTTLTTRFGYGTSFVGPDGIILRPPNLESWCWTLIARDAWQDITYSVCEGCRVSNLSPRVWREIPSSGVPTLNFRGGRKNRFCGRRCTNRYSVAHRPAKAAQKHQKAAQKHLDGLRSELEQLRKVSRRAK